MFAKECFWDPPCVREKRKQRFSCEVILIKTYTDLHRDHGPGIQNYLKLG